MSGTKHSDRPALCRWLRRRWLPRWLHRDADGQEQSQEEETVY